jgi:NADH-quinone oxidoreductase subunit L
MGLVALAQRDLKQLLAASTCAQVGFMFLAAGSGAVTGGALQLVAHAATKALLFCVAGAWLTALGSKQLRTLRGAARRWRGPGILFTVGSLGLAGVPPLAIWAAKDAALAQAARHNLWLYAAGLLGAVLSAAYSARALSIVWQPARPDTAASYDQEQPGTRRIEHSALAPVAVLGVFTVALVVLGLPPLTDRLSRALGPPQARLSTPSLTLSAALAALTLAFVWWWVARDRRLPVQLPGAVMALARSWWGLETAARRGIGAPVLAAAAALAWFDDHILDAAVHAAARGTCGLAGCAARVGEFGVEEAVAAVAGGAKRLGALARRPQTGQLHQYYAQAAAVFAAFLVLLLIVR